MSDLQFAVLAIAIVALVALRSKRPLSIRTTLGQVTVGESETTPRDSKGTKGNRNQRPKKPRKR